MQFERVESKRNWLRGVLGIALGAIVAPGVTARPLAAAFESVPMVSIVSPLMNEQVSGPISFYASADEDGVQGIQFQVDGVDYGSEITSGACRVIWDSTQSTDGLHTVQVVARDQYSNTLLAQPITFLVNNFAPSPSPTPTPSPSQISQVVLSPSTVGEGQDSQATPLDAAGNVVSGITWGFDKDFIG